MSAVIAIPARYGSPRFPGKLVTKFYGEAEDSRPLIEHKWLVGITDPGVVAIYVATDNDQIAEACCVSCASIVMMSPICRNGSERCVEALSETESINILINLQGDCSLTPSWFMSRLIIMLREGIRFNAATPILKWGEVVFARLRNDRKQQRVDRTAVVFDVNQREIYSPMRAPSFDCEGAFNRVGVYACKLATHASYFRRSKGNLKQSEGITWRGFLESGSDMLCAEADIKEREFWELSNPEDKQVIEWVLGDKYV